MSTESAGPIEVLHVEDDADFADLAATLLERERPNISVTGAEDADAALEVLESGEVDCVVSDYDMPGKNGLELLEAVRGRDEKLPFILFTGKGSEEIASDAISAGVSDYLQKRGGTDQYTVLANRIENAVEKHRVERELEKTRRRYELLGRASADAFWDRDLTAGTVERSDGFTRLFGYEESEIEPTNDWWRERLHPEDRERVVESIAEVIDGEQDTYEAHYRFRNADGTYSYVYARGHVLFEDDEPVRAIGSLTDVTDLRQRERELEAVRSRLELALHGTDTGVWERDPESGGVSWDRTVERLFGLDPGAFEGTYEAFLRRVHPDDRELVDVQTERTVSSDERYDEEFRILREDGETRWVESKGVLEEADDGEGPRLIGLISDVTERKERESRARQSQRRFEAIFDDPDTFIGLLGTDGSVIRVNETALEFVGVDLEEVRGVSFPETPWWDHSAALQEEIREGIERAADGEFVRFEADHYGVDGTHVVVDGHLRPVTQNGEVVSILVEGFEVGDRVERDRMIQRLHEATRELVLAEDVEAVARIVVDAADEALGHPITVVRLQENGELRPVAVSEAAGDELGERPTYAVGETAVGEAFERGEPLVYDDVRSIDDGYDRGDARAAVYLPIAEHGTLSVGSTEPGTFNESDVQILEILAANAAVVLDRFEDERALRLRERKLARQNERLEQFAKVIGHDLRNPLSVAQGGMSMLEVDGSEREREIVENALERMNTLLSDVLKLAAEGQLVGDPEPVSVETVAKLAWGTVPTEDVGLEVDDVGVVEADPTRLQELFENLFRNAVEHGDPDGRVRVGPVEGGFFVEDDGPGLPPDERDLVLEPGYTTREGGTGFGLAIVESIVDAHGWQLTVTESTESGARFEVATDDRG